VPIAFLQDDKEKEIMSSGAKELEGQEMHLIDLHMHEWIVHSQCVALSNKQHFGIITT
jgi:ribonuclease I